MSSVCKRALHKCLLGTSCFVAINNLSLVVGLQLKLRDGRETGDKGSPNHLLLSVREGTNSSSNSTPQMASAASPPPAVAPLAGNVYPSIQIVKIAFINSHPCRLWRDIAQVLIFLVSLSLSFRLTRRRYRWYYKNNLLERQPAGHFPAIGLPNKHPPPALPTPKS